jgi:hypothetical protein
MSRRTHLQLPPSSFPITLRNQNEYELWNTLPRTEHKVPVHPQSSSFPRTDCGNLISLDHCKLNHLELMLALEVRSWTGERINDGDEDGIGEFVVGFSLTHSHLHIWSWSTPSLHLRQLNVPPPNLQAQPQLL